MKKVYMTPSIDMVEIKTVSILAGSMDNVSNEEASEGNEENPVNFSRRRSFSPWYFDDEE